jgi:hypothetical protein
VRIPEPEVGLARSPGSASDAADTPRTRIQHGKVKFLPERSLLIERKLLLP